LRISSIIGSSDSFIRVSYIDRPNRFTVEVLFDGRTVKAYLPNPGRLQELLLPGATLLIAKNPDPSRRSTDYTVIAVEKEGVPVVLHTHLANSIVERLIEKNMVPGLEGFSVVRTEVSIGKSRFDFLLEKDGRELIMEVKSCTLFGEEIAMFPDAVTVRGRRHISELAELTSKGREGMVLFLVHWPSARYFIPGFHTDLDFARSLYELRNHLKVEAVSLGWERDLSLGSDIRSLTIPWGMIGRESQDRGSYIVILRLDRSQSLHVGRLGKIHFRKGYYLYVGSAMKNLTRRMKRHQRRRKGLFWHIDYLRNHTEFCYALPVRSSRPLECEIAGALKGISDWLVPFFGASDCSCTTHLFGVNINPLKSEGFIRLLQYFRIDRLTDELHS
jgi:sugar fermentation stimulation protein A